MIYEYCPKCGSKCKDQKDASKFDCSNCGQTIYLNSKPTASTLIVDGNKVLLGKRSREPEKGKWDVIGGFVEYGEHPADAAVREAKEETGLDVKIEELLGIFMDVYGADKISTLNICYVVKVIGGSEKANDDINELKWFESDSLPDDIAFQNNRDMLNLWVKRINS
jgi:ADP-ribose pyrophosphatase YjhB (NUDIX family)